MKKNKVKSVIGVVLAAFILALGLSACDGSTSNKLEGMWKADNPESFVTETYIFKEENEVITVSTHMRAVEFYEYRIEDDLLIYAGGACSFSIKGKTLTIDGKTYKKQKITDDPNISSKLEGTWCAEVGQAFVTGTYIFKGEDELTTISAKLGWESYYNYIVVGDLLIYGGIAYAFSITKNDTLIVDGHTYYKANDN